MSIEEHREKSDKRLIKVLVVDDEKCVREALTHGLSMKGIFCIREAANGKEALEELNREKTDVILLDVTMPVMDGFQTYKKLKENPETRHIPVIFMTARPYSDIVKDMPIGAGEYIEKPYEFEEVYARINKIVNSDSK